MSEFDEAMSGMLAEAAGVLGGTAFMIGTTAFTGDLDELGDQSYAIVDGGKEMAVNAHLVCQLAVFAGTIPAAGTRLKIGTRRFVIATVSQDAISVTLSLAAPDSH